MQTCKTCCWWEDGRCNVIDTKIAEKPETRFEIDVRVDDDSGLNVKLKTGPDFGCVLHEETK